LFRAQLRVLTRPTQSSSTGALAPRRIDDHRDARVARYEAVPEQGDFAVAGEDVDVLAFDGEAAVFGDEAAVVFGGAGGVAGDAVVFGDVEWGAEGDDGGVDRDGDERCDALAGGAAAPRKLLF